jgi:hypothetical protein
MRRRRAVPLLAELSRGGALTQIMPDLLHSIARLHGVRLLRYAARTHELVLLGFLDRHYASQIARAPRADVRGATK